MPCRPRLHPGAWRVAIGSGRRPCRHFSNAPLGGLGPTFLGGAAQKRADIASMRPPPLPPRSTVADGGCWPVPGSALWLRSWVPVIQYPAVFDEFRLLGSCPSCCLGVACPIPGDALSALDPFDAPEVLPAAACLLAVAGGCWALLIRLGLVAAACLPSTIGRQTSAFECLLGLTTRSKSLLVLLCRRWAPQRPSPAEAPGASSAALVVGPPCLVLVQQLCLVLFDLRPPRWCSRWWPFLAA